MVDEPGPSRALNSQGVGRHDALEGIKRAEGGVDRLLERAGGGVGGIGDLQAERGGEEKSARCKFDMRER